MNDLFLEPFFSNCWKIKEMRRHHCFSLDGRFSFCPFLVWYNLTKGTICGARRGL